MKPFFKDTVNAQISKDVRTKNSAKLIMIVERMASVVLAPLAFTNVNAFMTLFVLVVRLLRIKRGNTQKGL